MDIIEQRLALVHQVGKLKVKHGKKVWDPKREKSMIGRLRNQAIKRNINPELIEDMMRRLMRESYVNESNLGSQQIKPEGAHVIIIGGHGKMGGMFANAFKRSGYHPHLLDKNDDINDPKHYHQADLVLISVPIHVTESVIEQLPPLPSQCVLADLTSVKSKPLLKMLAKHSGPVVGLHPMFGPSTPSMVRQTIVQCDGRNSDAYQWLMDQFRLWGADVILTDAQHHDKQMAIIQALRHFTTFVYGFFLMQEGADLEDLLLFSSPIYRLELSLVGRLFAQSPELYTDIILSSSNNTDLIGRYGRTLELLTDVLQHKDKRQLVKLFNKVVRYFEPEAKFLMENTDHLLELSNKLQDKNA